VDAATATYGAQMDLHVDEGNGSAGSEDDLFIRLDGNAAANAGTIEFERIGNFEMGISSSNGTTGAGFIDLYEDEDSANDYKVRIIAPTITEGSDITMTLPVDEGNANDILATDGAGTLSWTSAGAATKWSDIASPTSDMTLNTSTYSSVITMPATAPTGDHMMSFEATGAFANDAVVNVEQLTGDPTDGTLLRLALADTEAHVDQLAILNGADDYELTRLLEGGSITRSLVSDGDAQWVFTTTETNNTADTTGIFEIIADSGAATMDADQDIFNVVKGVFSVDEDGDTLQIGTITTTANGITLGDTSAGDPAITFDSGNDGTITWEEDGSDFEIAGDIEVAGRISNTLTTEQLRLSYDADDYATVTVDATGVTTIATVDSDGAVGNLVFSPDGTVSMTVATDVAAAFTANGITIDTGGNLTLGSTRWDNGSDAIDGEQIAADTIDNDSIDWADMTDLTTDGAVVWGNITAGELADDSIVDADIDQDGTFTLTGAWTVGALISSTFAPTDDVTIADTKSIKSGAAASDYFSIETTDDVGGTPAQVEAMRVTVAGTSDAPLVEIGDSGATSPKTVTYLQAGPDAMANEGYNGIVITGRNAGEAIDQGNPVYWDATDSEWKEADGDVAGKFPAQGIALATGSDGNPLDVLVQGVMRHDDWAGGFVAGDIIYLDDDPSDNAGIDDDLLATANDCVQVIGFALSDDEVYFNFTGVWALVE
jgi:hypothetical protein